ncbi:MAG: hypothetical protein ABW098_17445 [Candidatus Thiodiazotropha sp.]
MDIIPGVAHTVEKGIGMLSESNMLPVQVAQHGSPFSQAKVETTQWFVALRYQRMNVKKAILLISLVAIKPKQSNT